jgi:hypothetical protein
MPTTAATSPVLAIPSPGDSSPVDVPADLRALVTALDTKGVPRYTTTGNRNTAMMAIGGAIAGMVAYTAGVLELCTVGGGTGTWTTIAPASRVGCSLARTTTLSIPSGGSPTDITWPTETADTHGFYTPTGSIVTIPAGLGGLYSISARVQLASTVTQNALIRLTAAGLDWDTGITPSDRRALGITLPLAAGDTVKVAAFQASGAAVNVATAHLHVYRVGA